MIYEYRALGEMIMLGENQSTHRKNCPSATLSTTNPACTGLGLNPGLYSDRLAIHQTHGTGRVLLAYCCRTHDFPVHVLTIVNTVYLEYSAVEILWH